MAKFQRKSKLLGNLQTNLIVKKNWQVHKLELILFNSFVVILILYVTLLSSKSFECEKTIESKDIMIKWQ